MLSAFELFEAFAVYDDVFDECIRELGDVAGILSGDVCVDIVCGVISGRELSIFRLTAENGFGKRERM